MTSSLDFSNEIDRLLETYLLLLDQYTLLRSQLSAAQISTQQHLARAKFHAPPGVSYGEAMYDGRMKASRLLTTNESGGVVIIKSDRTEKKDVDLDLDVEAEVEEKAQKEEKEKKKKKKKNPKPKDPIRMFGLLAPSALRQAQADSIGMVEKIIPEICRLDREMGEVEIKIRRARKFRGKAEERELKEKGGGEGVVTVAGLSIEA